MPYIRLGLLFLACLWLTACNTHVHEPWVQNPSYLKQERTRTPQLNARLEHRVLDQRDR